MATGDVSPRSAVDRRRWVWLAVLVLVVATLPADPAHAQPTFELEPTAGPTGQRVEVTGQEFADDAQVGVFFGFDETYGPSTPVDLRVALTTSDENGVIATQFLVPPLGFFDDPGERLVGACTVNTTFEPIGQCQPLVNGFERPLADFTHLGDPAVTVSPQWAQVGSTVTVTGQRFSSQGCGPVEVVLDPGGDQERVLGNPELSSDGPGSPADFSLVFTLPDVPVDAYAVQARQQSDGCDVTASDNLDVFTFEVSPDAGLAGSDATAMGEGFPAASECGPVEVAFDGTVVAEVATTGFPGDPFAVDFEVPARDLGDYVVTGTQGGCGDYLGRDDFTVTADPAIALDPASGVVGTEAQATVTGFPDAAVCGPVAVAFDDEPMGDVDPVDDGAPIEAEVVVPERPSGEYPVTATQDGDGCGLLVASEIFTVQPDASLAVDPDQGPIETEVEVTGTGFEDAVGVLVSFDDVEAVAVPPTAVTDGGFTVDTEVPPGVPGGPVVVTACQRCDTPDARLATTDFLVLPRLELDPEVGPPGMATVATVDGLVPGTTVVLDWEPGLGAVEATADGVGVVERSVLVLHHDRLGQRELQTTVDGTPYVLDDPDDDVAPTPDDFDLAAEYLVVPGTAQPRDFATRR